MIDYMFYRKTGIEDPVSFYKCAKHPDDILEVFEHGRSDIPYVDQFETTNNCNLRCRMCPRTSNMTRPITMVRDSIFNRLIDEIAEWEEEKNHRGISPKDFHANPPPALLWHGSDHDILDLRVHHFGSPSLDKRLDDRLAYVASKNSFRAQLSETVINLRLDRVRKWFKSRLGRLIIALDATNGEEFRANRGRPINFKSEVEKIKDIAAMKVEEGHDTTLHLQLIQLENAQANKFADMWQDIEGLEVLHKPFFPYPDIDHAAGKLEGSAFDAQCLIPFTSITILADGRVVPCNSDYNGEEILGDLNSQTLEEVWNGDTLKKFRDKFVRQTFDEESLCSRCGFYPYYTA